MLILTSPSKTLDLASVYPDVPVSIPEFINESAEIHKVLYKKNPEELATILDVNQKKAEENYHRYQNWATDHNIINSRPAIYTFAGTIFQEMHVKKYTKMQREYAQNSLRIISGFYGLLRPFDLIQPYRLEMHTSLSIAGRNDLYHFWTPMLTDYLQEECGHKNIILNLASEEYTKAIDFKSIDAPVIHIEFLQNRGGKTSNYGLLTKRARGMMIDYCIKHEISDIKNLKGFDTAGYKFVHERKDGSMTFIQTN